MKQILAAVGLIFLVVFLIVISFTIRQVDEERTNLTNDLEYRTALLSDSLKESIEPNLNPNSKEYIQRVVDRFTNRERLAGLAVYDNKENLIAISKGLPQNLEEAKTIAANSMDENRINADFIAAEGKKMYSFASPLRNQESVVGSLMIFQNSSYIDERIWEIWQTNLIRMLLQASLLSIAILLILRGVIYQPIISLVEAIRQARTGQTSPGDKKIPNFFLFRPLVNEVTKLSRSLSEARLVASEEARMRLQKIESPWTAERLKEFMKVILKGRQIFVVSNREPYIHTKEGNKQGFSSNKISYFVPASGMVTAIEPVIDASGGMWIAHGSGNADRLVVDKDDKVQVPPDEPKYTLKRVWLTEEEEKGYYYGFANEGIWPLCHIAHNRPTFRKEDWFEYQKVNQKFADVILSETKNINRPVIFIQDYHFALLPRLIKEKRPDALIGIFWHIPWPNPESFSICPFRKELLDGLLGCDLVGFHTQLHCNNFIDTVAKELEALIDLEQFAITKDEHTTYIKPFPISIDFPNGHSNHDEFSDEELFHEKNEFLKNQGLETQFLGVGVDRLDYTKGILERFRAVESFLDINPQYIGKFTFVQIAAPSRSSIKAYKDFEEQVIDEVERINHKYRVKRFKAIILLKRHHNKQEINKFYKWADLCLVSSLHDGMNLVAKEFVSARSDEKGVLILSQFAGASRELKEALIINPYNAEQVGNSIKRALEMPLSEQQRRMRKMRETVKEFNIYRWSAEFLKALVNI